MDIWRYNSATAKMNQLVYVNKLKYGWAADGVLKSAERLVLTVFDKNLTEVSNQ